MVRMPVGIEDFKALITGGYYFVDKTDLIRRLIDSHGAVTLFARPRRFGKTLTMSMVDYFFNIAHKEEAETLFKGTNIEKAGPAYMKHLGSCPVLFLSLKDVKESDFGNMTARMGRLMAATCQKYHFLLDNPSVLDSEKTYFLRLENQEASPVDLQDSLRTLLDLLSRYYGKRALLLIDEYDAPVQTAWENGYYHEAVSFMRNFLSSALKTNPSLEFALLTGVLRIAKESIFSGLNNLSISTVISGGYADTFGFTKEEIRKMAEILGKTDKLQELSDWYDGYHFQNVEIYNPWSIINYFDQGCIATSYWVNTSGNSILAYLLQSADERRWQEIRDLMAGKSITSGINENVVYDTLNPDRTTLYTVLLFTGYLKCTGLVENRRGLYDLAIPNRELRDVFEDEIISRLGSGNSDIALHDMETAMISGNAESFQFNLQDILTRTAGIHDTAKAESFYHGLMLGFSLYYENNYRIESNRESGYGRFDLALIPKKKNLPGIIMEFKAVKEEKELPKAAEKAKNQIEEKAYDTAMTTAGITRIWKYGIAFCGKKVIVT